MNTEDNKRLVRRFYELERGKIVRHWMGFDRLGLLQQLGEASGPV